MNPLLRQIGIPALAAIAGWHASAFFGTRPDENQDGSKSHDVVVTGQEGFSDAGRPPDRRGNLGKTQSREPNDKDSQDALSSLKVLPSGDVLLPRELASRIQIFPVGIDFKVNRKEMALLGFSEEQCKELEGLIEEVKVDVVSNESQKYDIVSESDDEVVLKIPGHPDQVNEQLAKLQTKIGAIGKEKADILGLTTKAAFENLTASFGANDRLVRLKEKGDGKTEFEIIELNPGSWSKLGDKMQPLDDYRRVSIRSSKFDSPKVPERLKHLFSN